MITGYYAGVLVLLFVVLSVRVAMKRWKYKTGIGDGGEHELQKAIRVHGNFAEYVPLAILLIFILEQNHQESPFILHGLGATLLISRVMHAYGLSKTSKTSVARSGGTMLTMLVMIICAALLIYKYMMQF